LPYPQQTEIHKKRATKPSAAKGYFILTSDEAFKAKVNAKEEKERKEEEKLERKRVREEKAAEKAKTKSGKKQNSKQKENKDPASDDCFICTVPFDDEDGPMVQCDTCQRWMHIPKTHTLKINDEDPYFCFECHKA
jgi:hypothetical protein